MSTSADNNGPFNQTQARKNDNHRGPDLARSQMDSIILGKCVAPNIEQIRKMNKHDLFTINNDVVSQKNIERLDQLSRNPLSRMPTSPQSNYNPK